MNTVNTSVYMKNNIFSILIILLILSCSDDSNPVTSAEHIYFGEIAYNSLSETDKKSLLNGSIPSTVEKGIYIKSGESNIMILDNDQRLHFYITKENFSLQFNQKLIAVFFNTINDSLLGPIIIIIDLNTEEAVGTVGRL